MLIYRPETFASLHDSKRGPHIWRFLTRDDNVSRLETASQWSKPAVQDAEATHAEQDPVALVAAE